MAYCAHKPHCANSACLVRRQMAGVPVPGQQESLLTRGLIQNLPGTPPFPGNNVNNTFFNQQGPHLPSFPGCATIQPPMYSQTAPMPMPQRTSPAIIPMNTYYPPTIPYMDYALLRRAPGQTLPPWYGNQQMPPGTVTGSMTPMPQGGFISGSQHPRSVTASHISNVPGNRSAVYDPSNAPIFTDRGGMLIPDGHSWMRGGGGDDWEINSDRSNQNPQDDDTDLPGECSSNWYGQRFSLDRSSPQAGHHSSEDGRHRRRHETRSAEDLRQAAQLLVSSSEHVVGPRRPSPQVSRRQSNLSTLPSEIVFDQDQSGNPGPSTHPESLIWSNQPQRRVLHRSRTGTLYDDVMNVEIDLSALNHVPYINHIHAHRRGIDRAVLDLHNVPYRLDKQNPHWVLLEFDVTQELLYDLPYYTRFRHARPIAHIGLDAYDPANMVSDMDSTENDDFTEGNPRSGHYLQGQDDPLSNSRPRGGGGFSGGVDARDSQDPNESPSTETRRLLHLSRTHQLSFGSKPLPASMQKQCAIPIHVKAHIHDIAPGVLCQYSIDYHTVPGHTMPGAALSAHAVPEQSKWIEIHYPLHTQPALLKSLLTATRKWYSAARRHAREAHESLPTEETSERMAQRYSPSEHNTKGKDKASMRAGSTNFAQLRGGASSPERDGSRSPFSTCRMPQGSVAENRCRLQATVEDYESDHSLSDAFADAADMEVESRNVRTRNVLNSTRSHGNLSSDSYSLNQEAAQGYRNAPLFSRQAIPSRPGSRLVVPVRGSGREELAPFHIHSGTEQPTLWHAIDLCSVPIGGYLNIMRNDPKMLTWRVFDASGSEIHAESLHRTGLQAVHSRRQVRIPGLTRPESGADDEEANDGRTGGTSG